MYKSANRQRVAQASLGKASDQGLVKVTVRMKKGRLTSNAAGARLGRCQAATPSSSMRTEGKCIEFRHRLGRKQGSKVAAKVYIVAELIVPQLYRTQAGLITVWLIEEYLSFDTLIELSNNNW